MTWWPTAIAVVASYFVGAIPVGYLLVRSHKGIDIRTVGSGNVGATNAARALGGKKYFFICFFIDVLKGLAPCLAVGLFAGHGWLRDPAPLPVVLSGIAAIAGHNWPVYIGFRGGKGVATSAGVLAYVAPAGVLVGLLAWLVVFAASRYISLASMVAAVATAVAVAWRNAGRLDEAKYVVGFAALVAVAVVVRHRSNIRRLLDGTEPKVVSKGKA